LSDHRDSSGVAPSLQPATVQGALAVQRVLLSHRGRYVSLCPVEAVGHEPALLECEWAELGRDLGLPHGASARVLVIPWEQNFGLSPDAYVRELAKAVQGDVHVCIVVTSSATELSRAMSLAVPPGVHVAVANAVDRNVLEPGEAGTALQQLFYEASVPPARAVDAQAAMRAFTRDVRKMSAFRERMGRLTGWAPVTAALCFICAVVFGMMVLAGVPLMGPSAVDLEAWGANGGFLVAKGQWWRLLTSAFVHAGALHLLINLWCLWNLGQFIERLFGSATFLVVFVLTAVGGGLASVATQPLVVSVGASGAVFGICGGLLGFLLIRRKAIPQAVLGGLAKNMIVLIAINLIFGMSVPAIDNAAHVGGLLTGFVCGLTLSRPLERESAGRLGIRMLVASVLGGTLLLIGVGVNRVVLQSPKWRSLIFLRACYDEYRAKVSATGEDIAQRIPRADAEEWIFKPELRNRIERDAAKVRSAIGSLQEYPSSSVRDLALQASKSLADCLESYYALSRTGKRRYLEATHSALARYARDHEALLIEADRLWFQTFGERLIE